MSSCDTLVMMKRVTRGVMLDCEEPAISAMTYVCRQSSLHIVRTPPSVTTSHVLCHIIHLQNCGLLDKMMLIYLKILLTYISVRPFSHFRLCPPVFSWILCWDESSSTSYHKIKTTRDLIFDELIPICKFLVCFCCVKLHILPTRDNTSIAQEPRICTHISIQICAIFSGISSKYWKKILRILCINPTSWRSHLQEVAWWWEVKAIRI